MSRRTKQPATSRRSRRAEQPQPAAAFAFAETPRIMSNPIFYCGNGPNQSKPPADQLSRPGSVRKLVHDPATAAAGSGTGKPLPLPPCRAHSAGPSGSHMPAVRVGPAVVGSGPHGRVLRRAPQDPFLAAYMACRKSAGGDGGKNDAQVKRPQQVQQKKTTTKKGKDGEIVRGCGIWNGWSVGAKYPGRAMSCKNGCVVASQPGDASSPAATAKVEAEAEAETHTGPTLDLSWAPAVLSARALERRRDQR